MIRYCIAVIAGLFGVVAVQAQYIRIGDGNILGSTAGPFVTNTTSANAYSRYAYIYAKSLLGNLTHGDTLRSVEFRRSAGSGLNSSTALKIYLNNTSAQDFGTGKLYWPGAITGAKLVYNQSPQFDLGVKDDYYKFTFSTPYVVDTTLGGNLQLFIEYSQSATQAAFVNFYYDNRFGIVAYQSNQVKYSAGTTLPDSLPNSTDVHPVMVLNFPRLDQDFQIIQLYTLGKNPVPLGNPDSMQVLMRNVGKKDQAAGKVYTRIRGANQLLDSTNFSLAAGESKYIHLKSMYPLKLGIDSVRAFVNDANPTGNSALSIRLENANVYSYRDLTQPPGPGGIGFNTNTGDFVAKFLSNKPKSINQVVVNFGFGGSAFRVGIWGTTMSGVPGTLIWQSDSFISVGGSYILPVSPPVSVNGSFFVGVRQLTNNNVAFGYQVEDPPRPGTFFYTSPLGSSNWLDFHPNIPYKFLIEPRLQADTDLTVTAILAPRDSMDKYTMDTIVPKVTVANVGAKDMLDSFTVTTRIFFNGNLQYSRSLRDTMSAGQKRTYTFPKTFKPSSLGEYEVIAYVSHPGDQVRDNDSMRQKFYVGVKKDVLFQDVYDPFDGQAFNYLKDTLFPLGLVKNAGYDNTVLFTTRCVIRNKAKTIYNKTINLKLLKFESRILSFPFYHCVDTGKWECLFITELPGDMSKANDTVRRTIFVRKYFDLLIDTVFLPGQPGFHAKGVGFKPRANVFNDGMILATQAELICRITTKYSNQVYRDTVKFDCEAGEIETVTMKRTFTPLKNGIYTAFFRTVFPMDYVSSNDSIKYDFYVGHPYDYSAIKVLEPLPTDTFIAGNGAVTPRLQLGNLGFIKNSDLVPVVYQIWNGNTKVYQDIKSLNLDTSMTFTLSMANFFPMAGGHHRIIAYTNYVSDTRRKNDTALGSFFVEIGQDAYVLSIDSPLAQKYIAGISQLSIQARVGNHGKLAMNGVEVHAAIYKGQTLVFSDQGSVDLSPGELETFAFTQKFTPLDSGMYRLVVYTVHSGDLFNPNDTMTLWFEAIKQADVQPLAWLTPNAGTSNIIDGVPFKPKVRIANTGSDTAQKLSGMLYFLVVDSANSNTLFSDSTVFNNLASGSTLELEASSSLTLSLPGSYYFTAITGSATDIFHDNDTLVLKRIMQWSVTKAQSLSAVILFPNPVKELLQISGEPENSGIRIYGVDLREVRYKRVAQGLDVSHLSPGTYYLVLQHSGATSTLRFIKQ